MGSISHSFLVGLTTVSKIIKETCEALWTCLNKKALPYPLLTDDWLAISHNFENLWEFPHCVGAIDGKHIVIQVGHMIILGV